MLSSIEKKDQSCAVSDSPYLNLPDLDFYLYCDENFRVNRGVYNTIDKWLFQHGYENVQFRRILILSFLDSVAQTSSMNLKTKYVTFGHGGLTKKLNDFFYKGTK